MLREIANIKFSIEWNRNEMRIDIQKVWGKLTWKKINERIPVRITGNESRPQKIVSNIRKIGWVFKWRIDRTKCRAQKVKHIQKWKGYFRAFQIIRRAWG